MLLFLGVVEQNELIANTTVIEHFTSNLSPSSLIIIIDHYH